MHSFERMDLATALSQFDRTMANLELLQGLWKRYEEHIPTSPAFGLDTPEMHQIRREFADIAASLPAIDGKILDIELSPLDDISQMIWDYMEIGEQIEGYRASQESAYAPKKQLDDYQYRVIKRRRTLVRSRVEEVVAMVDDLLRSAVETDGGHEFPEDVDGWVCLRELTGELDRLRGTEVLSGTRIRELRRHMRFAEPCDLSDIVSEDWPSVRSALIDLVFEGEPLPVEVEDLGDLVRSKPTGSVTSRLAWGQIDDGDFERLVFDLLRSATTYENVEWLMKPNAPDRGRDISADQVSKDDLSTTKRRHVLFQCKHWQSRSIGISEIQTLLAEVELWSKNFSVVVIVTSGRFTQNAVDWREGREIKGEYPAVEFWSDSHLEHLLASRPALRSQYFREPSRICGEAGG